MTNTRSHEFAVALAHAATVLPMLQTLLAMHRSRLTLPVAQPRSRSTLAA